MSDNDWCICWPGSLLTQMGLLDIPFDLQVKEVYLGEQFFSKEPGWHMTQCCAFVAFRIDLLYSAQTLHLLRITLPFWLSV